MEKLLRIGQVCNLYGISLDTLRYYDRKGLLEPIVDKQNGYRYYSIEHLDTLEMILVGKYLEIPLEQIKENIDSESIENYLEMAQNHKRLIDAKQAALVKLAEYTENMTTMLKSINKHTNDNSFSTVSIKKSLDTNIYRVKLNNLFVNQNIPITNGIEALDQWFFYNVDDKGIITEDISTIGLSINYDIINENDIQSFQHTVAKESNESSYHLCGNYSHICFWGNEAELKEYLSLLSEHFKLKDSALFIKFKFALLHKNMKHEYWTDIYFRL